MKTTPNADKLVEILVSDPSHVPDLKPRIGWLGKSSREGHLRLYYTLEFNNYIEFTENDLVHAVSLESQLNPVGGTLVFLQREAKILHTSTTSRQAQAEWLTGDITTGHLRRAAAAGMLTLGGGGVQPLTTLTFLTFLTLLTWTPDIFDAAKANSAGGCPTSQTHCC